MKDKLPCNCSGRYGTENGHALDCNSGVDIEVYTANQTREALNALSEARRRLWALRFRFTALGMDDFELKVTAADRELAEISKLMNS